MKWHDPDEFEVHKADNIVNSAEETSYILLSTFHYFVLIATL